jgi:hypothetical protein
MKTYEYEQLVERLRVTRVALDHAKEDVYAEQSRLKAAQSVVVDLEFGVAVVQSKLFALAEKAV